MNCPNPECGKGNVTGAEKCEYCGTQLPITVAKSTDDMGKSFPPLSVIIHGCSLTLRSMGYSRLSYDRRLWLFSRTEVVQAPSLHARLD